ncbi:hypothetical protein FRX31_016885 [Thalictrum thalictroides]|uniref:Uncharacterized protein n=1 Tax=Thalictrum thalictroides TaxID=46969 RepID=A0A7J6W9L6_THATH|nr:hypothetical protein FRX31_016885 [Thalictrum thalictroides]
MSRRFFPLVAHWTHGVSNHSLLPQLIASLDFVMKDTPKEDYKNPLLSPFPQPLIILITNNLVSNTIEDTIQCK